VQSVPQLIPVIAEVTAPAPAPLRTTVSANVCNEKVAVTVVAAFTVTTQLPVPVHPAPDQPVNVEPIAGEAVNVTVVPKE
jgi:hypothetical protein